MDPAGPLFQRYHSSARLNSTDAEFVDVIHTNGKGGVQALGTLIPLGHVDFYPNEAGRQPGCYTNRKRSVDGLYDDSSDDDNQEQSELLERLNAFIKNLTKNLLCSTLYPYF